MDVTEVEELRELNRLGVSRYSEALEVILGQRQQIERLRKAVENTRALRLEMQRLRKALDRVATTTSEPRIQQMCENALRDEGG